MTGLPSPLAAAKSYLEPGTPPPDRHDARFVYGLMQPLLGARVLLTHRALLAAALTPVVIVALFCAVLVVAGGGWDPRSSWDPRSMAYHYYRVFAFLAPLPSVLLAGLYARLVVKARARFALPAARPRLERLWVRIRRWLAQLVVMSIALAPLALLLSMVPFAGRWAWQAVAALWALHWIVVDALDGVRVDREVEDMAGPHAPSPWFVRALARAGQVAVIGWPLRWLARQCDRLTRPWHEEIAFIEAHPSLVLGFALTTAALLATPVLNLFFRPVALVGAVHLLGPFERNRQG